MNRLRSLIVLVPVAFAAVALASCGGDDAADTATNRQAAEGRTDGAASGPPADDPTTSDERAVEGELPEGLRPFATFGRPAAVADQRAVARTVERYLALVDDGDWGAACSMVSRYLEQGYAQQQVSCTKALPEALAEFRKNAKGGLASSNVESVRVDSGKAAAFYRVSTLPQLDVLALQREGDTWKVGANLFE